jgi:molybdenum cofactor biosynthesis protein A
MSNKKHLQKSSLIDNFGRPINYLRISVTDRCNLRCVYCMPESGIRFLPKKEILTFEEIERITRILAEMGITKVRITGGEPFVRADLMHLIKSIRKINGIEEIHITTNGILTPRFIPELKEIGIAGINLSLDALDRERFRAITRRDKFDNVLETFHMALNYGIPLKINMVVMDNQNIPDIPLMANLAKEYLVDIRYIEEMPFNGAYANSNGNAKLIWNHRRIFAELQKAFPGIIEIDASPNSTSMNYHVPEFKGRIGIIAGFTRTFCGTCNRIRITAKGMLKTCLYDDGIFDLKNFLRNGATDQQIRKMFLSLIGNRPRDGFEAQKKRIHEIPVYESMSVIGG